MSSVPSSGTIPVDDVVVNELPRVAVPAVNLTAQEKDVPFVVTVLLPEPSNVTEPVADHVGVTFIIDIPPEILSVPVLVNVTAPADRLKLRHNNAPVRVTVYVPA